MIFRPNNRGYTFLEIALALGIIAVVFAAVIPVVSVSGAERRLRAGLDEIVQTVRGQRLEAERSGHEKVFILQEREMAIRDGVNLRSEAKLPKGMKLSVKFPQGEWEPADGQAWKIFSCGAVTPLSIRLADGRSWIEADFDFLTGGVAEERYSF